jgi:pilus assembly protein Flp/PilA
MLEYLRIVLAARVGSERGASAVEYGLLVAGVAVVLIATGKGLGTVLTAVFEKQHTQLQNP